MDKGTKDPLYSDKYTSTDFTWGQSLGEGKFNYLDFQNILGRTIIRIITSL